MRTLHYLVIVTVALLTGCTQRPALEVTDAWIRVPPPGTQVAVGYFTIANHNDVPLALTGAGCDACGSVEIHTHLHDGDVMRMRRLERIELAPGEVVSFAPGGHHLMLMQFANVTSPAIDVTLQFSDGSTLRVPFELRSVTGAPPS